jgi:hypothetical protein
MLILEWGIRAGEPSLCRRQVPSPEVFEAGLGIPFFAGKLSKAPF